MVQQKKMSGTAFRVGLIVIGLALCFSGMPELGAIVLFCWIISGCIHWFKKVEH